MDELFLPGGETKVPIPNSLVATALLTLVYIVTIAVYGALGFNIGDNGPRYQLWWDVATYADKSAINETTTWITSSKSLDGSYEVKLSNMRILVSVVLTVAYGFCAIFIWGKSSAAKKDAAARGVPVDKNADKHYNEFTSIALCIGQIILWLNVQTDLMVILGNNDFAASFLATGVILSQAVLYLVSDRNRSMLLRIMQVRDDKKYGVKITAEDVPLMGETFSKNTSSKDESLVFNPIVAVASMAMAFYLYAMVLMSLFYPVSTMLKDSNGIAIFPWEYKFVLGFYVADQTVNLGMHILTTITASFIAKSEGGKEMQKQLMHDGRQFLLHALLLATALTYVFAPMELMKDVGCLYECV